MVDLTGREVLQVTGVGTDGKPSGQTQTVTTQQIADIATGAGTSATFSDLTITGHFYQTDATTQYGTSTAIAATVIPAASVAGAPDTTLNMTGALVLSTTLTLPTAAQVVAAIPGAYAGKSYALRIINSTSNTGSWTVTTSTGWTVNGTMSIAPQTWRDFYVTLTTLTALVLQARGTGTNS